MKELFELFWLFAKMGSVTAVQKERMEAQFQYWNNAKALV